MRQSEEGFASTGGGGGCIVAPHRGCTSCLPLASCSGPFRFNYHEGRWVYHRDGRDLQQQLAQEIGGLLGQAPSLEADA